MYISHPIPLVLTFILSWFYTNQSISSANQPTPRNPLPQFTVRHHRYYPLNVQFLSFFRSIHESKFPQFLHSCTVFFLTCLFFLLSVLLVYVWCTKEMLSCEMVTRMWLRSSVIRSNLSQIYESPSPPWNTEIVKYTTKAVGFPLWLRIRWSHFFQVWVQHPLHPTPSALAHTWASSPWNGFKFRSTNCFSTLLQPKAFSRCPWSRTRISLYRRDDDVCRIFSPGCHCQWYIHCPDLRPEAGGRVLGTYSIPTSPS